jgi:hypothetical protein
MESHLDIVKLLQPPRQSRGEVPGWFRHMLGAGPSGFQCQLDGNQHGLPSEDGHSRERLRHDSIAAVETRQRAAELLQWGRQIGGRRAIAQGTWLALDQRQVVLPVVDHVITIAGTKVSTPFLERLVRRVISLIDRPS